MKILILFIMLFLHIVDDYYLQGILAKMKQKSFWEENAPDPMYKNDYIVALVEHAFSWTFMIMLPAMVWMFYYQNIHSGWYVILFVWNVVLHSLVDHAKANMKLINLYEDQRVHFIQIMMTWILMFYWVLK
jgi:hypothetical protein